MKSIIPTTEYFLYITVNAWCVLLCLTLCHPMDCIAHQAPLSMEFSRQEYWSGLQFPSPGDLSKPGLEPESPSLAGGFFIIAQPGKPISEYISSKLY